MYVYIYIYIGPKWGDIHNREGAPRSRRGFAKYAASGCRSPDSEFRDLISNQDLKQNLIRTPQKIVMTQISWLRHTHLHSTLRPKPELSVHKYGPSDSCLHQILLRALSNFVELLRYHENPLALEKHKDEGYAFIVEGLGPTMN